MFTSGRVCFIGVEKYTNTVYSIITHLLTIYLKMERDMLNGATHAAGVAVSKNLTWAGTGSRHFLFRLSLSPYNAGIQVEKKISFIIIILIFSVRKIRI